MAWFKLNDGLNTLKGQISNVSNAVQEAFAEGNDEIDVEPDTRIQDAEKQIEHLSIVCKDQDQEIIALRQKIQQLEQVKTTDSGGGGGGGGVTKPLTENNAFEESWFWDTEQTTASSSSSKDNERATDSPGDGGGGGVGTGGDLTIIPLDGSSHGGNVIDPTDKLYRLIDERDHRIREIQSENVALKNRIQELNAENQEVNRNIDELDRQHGITIENLLTIKQDIQHRCDALVKEQENLIDTNDKVIANLNELKEKYQQMEQSYINGLQPNGQLQTQCDQMNNDLKQKSIENEKLVALLKEKEKELSDKFEYIDVEKEKLNQIDDAQSTINELRDKLNELDDCKQSCRLLQSELDVSVEAKSKLEAEINRLIENQKKLEQQLNDYETIRREKETIEHEYSTLQEDDLILQKEFYELKKNNTILRDDCADLRKTYHDLNENYENVVKQLEHVREQHHQQSQLEEEFRNLKESASESESRLIQENVILHKQVIDLQSSLNSRSIQKIAIRQDSTTQAADIEFNNILRNHFADHIDSGTLDTGGTDAILKSISDKLNHYHGLESELEQTKRERNQLQNLEEDVDILNAKNSELSNDQKRLKHENETIRADLHHYEVEVAQLMKNNELLLNEMDALKSSNKLETISEQNEDNLVHLEKQLEDCSNLNRNLEDEYDELQQELVELRNEIETKRSEIEHLTEQQQLNGQRIDEVTQQLKQSELEKSNLLFELNELKTGDSKVILEQQINEQKCAVMALQQQLDRLNQDHANLIVKLQSLEKASVDKDKLHQLECVDKESIIQQKDELLAKKDADIKELLNEVHNLKADDEREHQTQLLHQKDEELCSLQGIIETNKTELIEIAEKLQQNNMEKIKLSEEIDALKSETDALRKKLEENVTGGNIEEMTNQQQTIDTLMQEKSEMINLITIKHQENIQYHSEIQRLTNQLKLEMETNRNCSNCLNLKQQNNDLQQQLNDMEKLRDQVAVLKEKSAILTENLMTEQTNQRHVQHEKSELLEEKLALSRELERLREHLLETAEAHMHETLELQKIIDETKQKMAETEADARHSSTAYTSASIRANQQAETLQAQYALLTQQRDELLAKLSNAEDKESRNEAALINLQCALEQFQKNKERDIEITTHRIRKDFESEQLKQAQLLNEIDNLKIQLHESKTGLMAAGRITDQLELCQAANVTLKDEVSVYKLKLENYERKLNEIETSHADKVEKGLLKNLLIGYIVAPNNTDKMQILKLISSVLDFNMAESNKVGLNKTQAGWLSSIVNAAAGANNNNSDSSDYHKDSLAQAFVKFLEKESQPRRNSNTAANLLNIVHTQASVETTTTTTTTTTAAATSLSSAITEPVLVTNSNRSSPTAVLLQQHQQQQQQQHQLTNNPTSNTSQQPPVAIIQPILLSDTVLQNFAPPRNSSSILKDILNDS